ncbi:MAG TPA: DinB family protein [Vicinamibacterales bacterium]|nr:DinB family protein [Vicinamibacterales bacterium]
MRTMVTLVLVATIAAPAFAQPAANPISDGIRTQWNAVKRNIQQSAELMPDATFDYRPVDGVRSFSEILAHVAGASYAMCAAAKDEKTPFAEDYFEKNAKGRAAIAKATTEAIAYCDAAFTALTDANAGQMVPNPLGDGQRTRTSVLVLQIGHDNEHYGNLVTYFRMNGIVPPSSRR